MTQPLLDLGDIGAVFESVGRGRGAQRMWAEEESHELARHALLLRYESVEAAPIAPRTLLKSRRTEDEGPDLWRCTNRLQENLERGGVSDFHRDKRGKVRSMRALRGIDSRVSVNKRLWGLAERLADGKPLDVSPTVELVA